MLHVHTYTPHTSHHCERCMRTPHSLTRLCGRHLIHTQEVQASPDPHTKSVGVTQSTHTFVWGRPIHNGGFWVGVTQSTHTFCGGHPIYVTNLAASPSLHTFCADVTQSTHANVWGVTQSVHEKWGRHPIHTHILWASPNPHNRPLGGGHPVYAHKVRASPNLRRICCGVTQSTHLKCGRHPIYAVL